MFSFLVSLFLSNCKFLPCHFSFHFPASGVLHMIVISAHMITDAVPRLPISPAYVRSASSTSTLRLLQYGDW